MRSACRHGACNSPALRRARQGGGSEAQPLTSLACSVAGYASCTQLPPCLRDALNLRAWAGGRLLCLRNARGGKRRRGCRLSAAGGGDGGLLQQAPCQVGRAGGARWVEEAARENARRKLAGAQRSAAAAACRRTTPCASPCCRRRSRSCWALLLQQGWRGGGRVGGQQPSPVGQPRGAAFGAGGASLHCSAHRGSAVTAQAAAKASRRAKWRRVIVGRGAGSCSWLNEVAGGTPAVQPGRALRASMRDAQREAGRSCALGRADRCLLPLGL